MRACIALGAVALAGTVASSCSGDPLALVGRRADGLLVVCTEQGRDRYACEPQPGALPGDDGSRAGSGDGDGAGVPSDAPAGPASDGAPAGSDPCAPWLDGGGALVLWPPNHELHAITLADCAAARPACEVAQALAVGGGSIVAVSSDEPLDVGAGGDGHTPGGDLAIRDGSTVLLRAERQGGSDGRVYRIEIAGPAGRDACEVHVPHDRGPYGGAIDSGSAIVLR